MARTIEHLHATDIDSFLQCRRAFKYSKIDRLKPKGDEPEYFDFGTKGHTVLKAHYENNDPWGVLTNMENAEHRSHHTALYDQYLKQYPDDKKNWQIASVDQSMSINVEGIDIIFTVDLLVLAQHKPLPKYTVVDHKFYKSFPDEVFLDYDFQASFYLWALNKLGLKVNDFILNVIKKSPAQMPMPLQNGKLSKDKSKLDNTELELYLEAIAQLGLDPREYEPQLNYLRERGSGTFKRYPVSRNAKQLANFELDLIAVMREIHDDNTRFYPIAKPMQCPRCPFRFLCKLESAGSDVNYTKRSMFDRKEADER